MKKPATGWPRAKISCSKPRLGLLHHSGFNGLHGHPYPLGATVSGLDANALKIRPKLALRDAGHVRADAAALLRLTLAIDDRALNGTATGDCTDSGHDASSWLKGRE